VDGNPRLFEIFLEVQRGLPRQGPGCDECTLKALSLCPNLPDQPAILDIGCGPGMQTIALAKAVNGRITAIDSQQEYLDQLKERAVVSGVAERVEVHAGDMRSLPFEPQSFDVIWSEGAAYIMGVGQALTSWRRLLKPGGCAAFSELVWLRPDPPAEAREFFAAEYPPMTDTATVKDTIRDCGYDVSGHFTLPDAAWWRHYYAPLEAKLPSLLEKFSGDEEALGVLEMTRREIDVRRRLGEWFGYVFFVASIDESRSR
jgi:ubiquinone/menaquinone biosynthesis C-methylase UbiE